jgi:chorismate mutase
VRRYSSPEEHPFSKEQLPAPVLQPLRFPALLCNNTVNVNDEILRWYIDRVIPALCVAGDDEQHGSSVLCDITALQALSKRIHLGKFVAESKFAADPATYCELLASDDVKGVVDLLTNVQVEERVLQVSICTAVDACAWLTEDVALQESISQDIHVWNGHNWRDSGLQSESFTHRFSLSRHDNPPD